MLLYSVRKSDRGRGFTLVEMIVAVVIVGVLAAVSTPNLLGTYRRTQANAAINEVESAIKEAQRQAIRNGRQCNISINSSARTIKIADTTDDRDCLLTNRVLDDSLVLNSNVSNITFSSRGNTTNNALIRVTTNGENVDRCVVVTAGIGLIRSGSYRDTDNNNTKDTCVTKDND